ncbi:MAG: hypothetical protein QGI45_02605 [Myxococcota bacterium]|nr:hypothetical protein [Myxococcota bacterium]
MRYLVTSPSNNERIGTIMAGKALANCFTPLSRKALVIPDVRIPHEAITKDTQALKISFLDVTHPRMSLPCFEESYFEQNRIHISESCPEDLCVNFNDIGPKDRSRFTFHKDKNLFCLSEGG